MNVEKLNIIKKISELKIKKNAVILGHYYQEPDVQDISDYLGDSLYLAQLAEKLSCKIIVLAGVYFMAESVKMLSPEKKVLLPDMNAGCSLAESITVADFKKFKSDYLGYTVVSYVNTSAEIKAMSDICCTSSNAVEIINSLPVNEKIIFTPDRNLGNYINKISGREMIVWNGACHVHEEFSLEGILKLKEQNPEAKIIAHPECKKQILIISDHIGSTSSLLKFVQKDEAKKYIVATESGILHQMKKACAEKIFIPAPPLDSTCGCNDCRYMKLITPEKIYQSLLTETPEIIMGEELMKKAVIPIKKMLEISAKLKL